MTFIIFWIEKRISVFGARANVIERAEAGAFRPFKLESNLIDV